MTTTLPSLDALLGKEKKSNVSFGTTKDRPLFPGKLPQNRMGAGMGLENAPHRAPCSYDNDEKTTFLYSIDKQVTSKNGYTMGARTGPRFRKEFATVTPCPSAYQTRHTEPTTFETSKKPFHVGANRFYRNTVDPELTPGAGTYEHNVPRNRKVAFHGTFGGPQLLKIQPDESVLLPEDCKGTTTKSRLMTYKDKRKFAIREAYLSLYY
ncbi:protein pitchfork-like isoform X2 [Patiria miniata]|uniref:Protein pitchfork n=1 Tax=Patiria miniata TaxID=46514 RepID=A0A914BNX4_PATMI|nr:protein pitchfork-like isoform X2 [Patiria miniata]